MPYLFNKYHPLREIIFCVGEGLLIFLSFCTIYYFLIGDYLYRYTLDTHILQAIVITFVFQLCLYFYDLYDLSRDITIADTITRMTQAFGLGCITLAILYYSMPLLTTAMNIFWPGYFTICGVVLIWRWLYYLILRKRIFVQNILIFGTGNFATQIAKEVEGKNDSAHKIVGFTGEGDVAFNPRNVPIHEKLDDLVMYCQENNVGTIVIALDDRRNKTPSGKLLACKLHGISVQQGAEFFESITSKLFVERIDPSAIFFSNGFTIGRWAKATKRIIDISLSILGIIISLPVTILSALIIKLSSPGPVFYLQERVGARGTTFKIIKFRSMSQDAEKDGAVWAMENDNRITPYGGFIRKTRIDEIPQLLNVLKGEMSLVGPRPERPVFVKELTESIPFYDIRHHVKPGITGWAQVCYRYGASAEDSLRKLEYDLYYMKNQSIALDILIMLQTVKTILFRKGSR